MAKSGGDSKLAVAGALTLVLAIAGVVAHDVAAVSARQGADVTLTSVFTTDKMQANKHEIEHALAEGITIRDGWAPVEVVRSADGRSAARR